MSFLSDNSAHSLGQSAPCFSAQKSGLYGRNRIGRSAPSLLRLALGVATGNGFAGFLHSQLLNKRWASKVCMSRRPSATT